MHKLAAVQSNFLPWRGYFDLIQKVNTFVLLDSVQYTKGDWRNRNIIKTPNGPKWLTLPVHASAREPIYNATVTDQEWSSRIEKTLRNFYSGSEFYMWAHPKISKILQESSKSMFLSDINHYLIREVMSLLEIHTEVKQDKQFANVSGKNDRLIQICLEAGADVYVSGPSAKSYIDESRFRSNGIEVEWFEYAKYSDYAQKWGDFLANVSIVDVLYNCGPSSRTFFSK